MTVSALDAFGPDWFRLSIMAAVLPKLIAAAGMTIYVSILSFAGALILGAPLLWARRSRLQLISRPAAVASNFIRSTPLLLQIYFYFFVLPQAGLMLPAVTTGVLALSIHYGCYVSEVYRAGLESLPNGQRDAATALGFSNFDAYRHVIIPQITPFLVPALGNLLVSIFKETPLLAAIAVTDIMFVAMQYGADHFQYIEPITACGLIFLVISLATSFAIRVLENVVSRGWRARRYAGV